ncbi:MAG: cysteine hydrolase family protein [Rubricella sp.]
MNALLLIDIQQGFDAPVWGARNNPGAEANAAGLLERWRSTGAPVIHIRHVSVEPGSPLTGDGARFKPEVTPEPGEAIFEKSVNSAFIGTGLQAHLRKEGITALTVAGLTTPHCVSTSVRMAANFGFAVTLVSDACAAFETNADTGFDDGPALDPETIHRTALAHLNGEFATVVPTARALASAP